MFQLSFYVPQAHVEPVKQALFSVGAGKLGKYEYCAWQVLGQGQFRPIEGSSSYLGNVGELEYVPEYKVEMVLEDSLVEKAIAALKAAHPYEMPAYAVVKLYND